MVSDMGILENLGFGFSDGDDKDPERVVRSAKPVLLSARLGMLKESFGFVVNGSHTFGRLIKAYGYAQDVKGAWRCWQEMRSRLIRLPFLLLIFQGF